MAELGGAPVIDHVVRNCLAATRLDAVVVATDDDRIAAAAAAAGAEVFRSRRDHPTGTDRIGEAAEELSLGERVIVNVQGDEPALGPDAIDQCVGALGLDPGADMATLAAPCHPDVVGEASVVKVVVTEEGRALYFSRAVIPWGDEEAGSRLRHIGIYAFRPGVLARFLALPRGRLEMSERLEQLRALEGGLTIQVTIGDFPSVGIDVPEDLDRARAQWRARGPGNA